MGGPWRLITTGRLILVVSFSATAVKTQIAGERRNLETQNQSFISIDCGVNEDYPDKTTGLYYTTDRDFIDTGDNGVVSPQFDYADDYFARLYRNLRYFLEGRKNCYTLKPQQGKNNNYLIVVYFKYGNYDGMNRAPNFDLYLGVSYWAAIQYLDQGQGYCYPAYHFSPSDSISMCLLNTGFGVPLISALELRLVNNSIYRTNSGFARVERRFNVGNSNNTRARYKDDAYDRIWAGFMLDDWVLLNTTQNLDIQTTNDSYKLPSEVLRTAVQPRDNNSLSFSINIPYNPPSFNVYFHFAELQMIPEGQKREFTITLNGNQPRPVTPQYLKPLIVVYEKAVVSDTVIQFSINRTAQSDLPQILNGFEILLDKDTNAETSPEPQHKQIVWVDSLEFSNLQELQSLDLSNNQLNGTVPEFLAELPNLAILNLSGNQLTGSLAQSLIEKFRNGTLNLSFDDGKSNSTVPCDKKKRNILIPILIAIISLLVLFNLIISAMYWRMKRHGVLANRSASLLISKNRSFTNSEIVNVTDNFANIIGEGGFGKVYHGELNDGTQVAVKLLSESSKQGFKEFLSEVQLLIIVYHRNLVSFIGYYEDHGNMALVYEFMENGNLRELLSDKTSYVLNWRERLQIALDSAQGLEYLHNGCKPPIVHRDLKTSNILLNENLVAKISDFGLSRVFANDKDTHVSTYPAGSFGYADPEVYVTGNLTKKSDIYSFGIILFELITGQHVVIKASEDQSIHILQWVTPMIESWDIQSIIDKRLDGELNTNSAWKIVEIPMSCVPTTAVERPDMSQVLTELKECLAMDMASGGNRTMRNVSSKKRSSNAREMSFIDVDTHVNPSVR